VEYSLYDIDKCERIYVFLGIMLEIPYKKQIHHNACAIAALEMVYRYYRPSMAAKFSQRKEFQKLKELEPHGSGNFRVSTDNIIKLARKKRLYANWGRVSSDPDVLYQQIEYFIKDQKIPLIVCQRYTVQQPQIGHFRVLLGVYKDEFFLHDPCPKTGGPMLRLGIDKCIDCWRYTGANVTGGVAVWVADRELNSPLEPDQPNRWVKFH